MAFIRRSSTTIPSDMFNASSYYNNLVYVNKRISDYYGVDYQCTDYAIARISEIAGGLITYYTSKGQSPSDCIGNNPIFNRAGYGDGANWYSDTRWTRTTNPSVVNVGDIVCFGEAQVTGGHVAVIEAVTNDSFIISEANYSNANRCSFTRVINKATGGGAGASGLQGYIINPYSERPTPPEPDMYYLSYSVSPSNAGYITGNAQGYYDEDEEVTIVAHANKGWKFKYWQGRSIDYNPIKTEIMNRDRDYIAYFEPDDAEVITALIKIKKKEDKINEITILL